MERQEVFEATHRYILSLVADGKVAGLRADHPDGLYDPRRYFQMLQEAAVREIARRVETIPATLTETLAKRRPLYVIAEKILAVDEPLAADWSIHGTSGYDFLNMVNGLFVDSSAEKAFDDLYRTQTGVTESVNELIYQKKRLILQISLASELQMLAHQLDRIAQLARHSRDFTLRAIRSALREIIACFPVYRSYITTSTVGPVDAANIQIAVERAAERNPKLDATLFEFVRDTLLQKSPNGHDDDTARRQARLRFAGKFQQLTSPVTAKGIEDTTFYIYNRFVSLNEVGGELSRFGTSAEQLHGYFLQRQRDWPYSMSALSTHDTKRSEDVRARLNVLSEIPDEWKSHVERWYEINSKYRQTVKGAAAPTANDEYLLYQTLLGAWPLEDNNSDEIQAFTKRVQAYMQKAIREAKVNSSWTDPNEPYEAAVDSFVAKLTEASNAREFLDSFLPFKRRIARAGLLNSLAQTLLRITAPGVPDTYQGTELWDFSLVDPDNRRPVHYEHRDHLLHPFDTSQPSGRDALIKDILQSPHDGRIKLFVTTVALRLRRDNAGLFTEGEYLPLKFTGPRSDQLFGFARRLGDRCCVVVVPRLASSVLRSDDESVLTFGRASFAGTTFRLPTEFPRSWQHAFTGQTFDVSDAVDANGLSDFPMLLLISK